MRALGTWDRAWRLTVVLLGVITVFYYGHHTPPVDLPRDLRSLPLALSDWRGAAVDLSEAPLRARGADEETARLYQDPAGRAVTLYVGYFRSQEQGHELIGLGSAEWHRRAEETSVAVEDGRRLWVNRTVLTEGRARHLVLFWYDLNGRSVTGRYLGKIVTAGQALTRFRSNGALVAVSTPLAAGEPTDKELASVVELVRALSPVLRDHLTASVGRLG